MTATDFSSQTYWEKRFGNEKSFEWLADTRALGATLLDLIQELSNTPSFPEHDIGLDGTESEDKGDHRDKKSVNRRRK